MSRQESGAESLCSVLESSGVEFVFGLPGTQTVGLYDAIRRSKLRAVVPTHELGATFMAMGYSRACGKVAVVLTIPGPGFAYTLAGLAEAKLDGVAIVHISLAPAKGPTGEPAFQALDQVAIVAPLVKGTFQIQDREALPRTISAAILLALAPDAGPVFVEINESVLSAAGNGVSVAASAKPPLSGEDVKGLLDSVVRARRPVFVIATDCSESLHLLLEISQQGRVPICVPPPSRGIVPEDHEWCLCFDDQRTEIGQLNSVLGQSDLVVLIGTRLGHVTTAGFRLQLAEQRTICVAPPGAPAIPHGYKARDTARLDAGLFLSLAAAAAARFSSVWTLAEAGALRKALAEHRPSDPPEPTIDGLTPSAFFAALNAVLPRDAILVTDSGLHQVMTRRYFDVLATGGLIFPSDFQSMGFGLPAAIGAKLAKTERPVIAVVGDGGFAMNGLELITAVRERVPLVVLVMNDGKLNLIRVQQIREFGRTAAVDLHGPDLAQLARALSVSYQRTAGNSAAAVRGALSRPHVTLIDVPVGDSAAIRKIQAKSLVRESVRGALGPTLVTWLKRRLRPE